MDKRQRPTNEDFNQLDIDAYLISAKRDGLTKKERQEYEQIIDLEYT